MEQKKERKKSKREIRLEAEAADQKQTQRKITGELRAHISERLASVDPEVRDEWLRFLSSGYSERFLKDNDRIWRIARIFIPLSLAGLIGVKDATFGGTLLLALGSVGLQWFWIIFAENHRAFQNKSVAIVDAIEQIMGLDLPSVGGQKVAPHKSIEGQILRTVQNMRWFMLRGTIIIWGAAVVLSFINACAHVSSLPPGQNAIQVINAFLQSSNESQSPSN